MTERISSGENTKKLLKSKQLNIVIDYLQSRRDDYRANVKSVHNRYNLKDRPVANLVSAVLGLTDIAKVDQYEDRAKNYEQLMEEAKIGQYTAVISMLEGDALQSLGRVSLLPYSKVSHLKAFALTNIGLRATDALGVFLPEKALALQERLYEAKRLVLDRIYNGV